MKLGKTFVRSMVREVGRNYGKAMSNTLLGDKHSTPYRRVGSGAAQAGGYSPGASAKKRMSKLEKHIKDFTRKTTERSMVSQALNIYDAYFEEVDEAQNNGGAIDLAEAMFIVEKSHDVRRCISVSIEQLEVLKKTDNVPLLKEKEEDIANLVSGIDQSLKEHLEKMDVSKIHEQPKTKQLSSVAILSALGLGQAYFKGNISDGSAIAQFAVWLLVILGIVGTYGNEETSWVATTLFTGYFVVYVGFISWRQAKKRQDEALIKQQKVRQLQSVEAQIKQVLDAM